MMSEKDPTRSEAWSDPAVPDLDDDGYVLPPWINFPNLPRASSGWRMGQGETYLQDFDIWLTRQPRSVRLALQTKYPAPPAWSLFWSSGSASSRST